MPSSHNKSKVVEIALIKEVFFHLIKTHRLHGVSPKDLIAVCQTSFLFLYTFTPQWLSVYQELASHIINSLAALHLQPLCSKTVLLLLPSTQPCSRRPLTKEQPRCPMETVSALIIDLHNPLDCSEIV